MGRLSGEYHLTTFYFRWEINKLGHDFILLALVGEGRLADSRLAILSFIIDSACWMPSLDVPLARQEPDAGNGTHKAGTRARPL